MQLRKESLKKIQAVDVDHAQELTGMGKGYTDIAFFCVLNSSSRCLVVSLIEKEI